MTTIRGLTRDRKHDPTTAPCTAPVPAPASYARGQKLSARQPHGPKSRSQTINLFFLDAPSNLRLRSIQRTMETNTFWQLVTEPWLMQRGSKLDRASEPATRVIVGFDCSVESSWGSESNLVQRPSMLSPSLAGEQRLRAPSVNTRSIPDKRSQNRCSRNSSCNPSPVSLAEPQAEPRQSPSGGRPASDNVNIGAPSR